ncbi:Sensor histidine kinase GlrK [Andreprevotia sp. IGB-42]|uniref:HAMP domain-containing sensor histidine kinase n=1 Tax=Andreprevotia sp. IGB-42 TaxID=2497473 RepID=UPI00135CD0AB|nr:HAMP domain-containing sensor histidine kinase [Andreprevotia sp. IGB-42]KAF0813562.1 Sensor histidine kinase GlrK [Andreprevotia sp. IGB-42]
MFRLSFRQLLFAAFIVIAGVLTATSLQALWTLERLTRLGREGAAQAVMLTEQSQRLAARTQGMERSARQFLVLDDALFRDRYVTEWRDAEAALAELVAALPDLPPEVPAEWAMQSKAAWTVLRGSQKQNRAGRPVLATVFARLPVLNEQVLRLGKAEITRRNDALLVALEHQRSVLTGLLAAAVVLVAVFAISFGMWLSRPLNRIKAAIARLGDNRLDQPVAVGGPADMQRLGQQLDWLRVRLADLDADKARFVRHISHELKTPLAAMREGVALLEDEVAGSLTSGQREIAGILRQNAVALQAQIEDLLRYNTASFDAQHLQRARVEITALLQRVISEQRLQWQRRNVLVTVSGDPVQVVADADRLAVAFANILSNAVRFSPDGGVIRFDVTGGAQGVTIRCADQGPGVAAADAARIFEPFYQGANQVAGARNGNGIGLSIVREYIAAHHGTVSLLPSDAGAHFQIELPYEA